MSERLPDLEDLLEALAREFPETEPRTSGAENEESPDASEDRGRARANWKVAVQTLPPEVTRLVGTIDLMTLRRSALGSIEEDLFGWANRTSAEGRLDVAAVRRAWRRALSGPQRDATLKVVTRAVDDVKRVAQAERLQEHEVASRLAAWQECPQVVGGILHVRDVSRGARTFGLRSYPEATPIEVVVYVVALWTKRTGREHPHSWDLTAGSGTVHDLLTTIFGGVVAGTDIAIDNRTTVCGSLDEPGEHALPRERGVPGVFRAPAPRVTTPDLVFLHPPSRGMPACSWLYGLRGRWDVAVHLRSDLAYMADRRAYVERIAKAVRTSLGRLAPGGMLSLLVPEYVRDHQQIAADRGIGDDILHLLGDGARLIERHEVVDDAPVRQTSLDRARGPLVHLILGRPGEGA
jgi:hypothetical protein